MGQRDSQGRSSHAKLINPFILQRRAVRCAAHLFGCFYIEKSWPHEFIFSFTTLLAGHLRKCGCLSAPRNYSKSVPLYAPPHRKGQEFNRLSEYIKPFHKEAQAVVWYCRYGSVEIICSTITFYCTTSTVK